MRHGAGQVRDNFGAGAAQNFPSGFDQSAWGQAQNNMGRADGDDPLRQTTR